MYVLLLRISCGCGGKMCSAWGVNPEGLDVGDLSIEWMKIKSAFGSRMVPPSLAKRLNLKHIVNGPDVLNAFQGVSERKIRSLFKAANEDENRYGAKSDLHIIIFDEIDSIAKAILENLHAFQIDGMKELIDEALLRNMRQAFVLDEDVNLQDIVTRAHSYAVVQAGERGLVKHHFLHAIEDIKSRLQESSLEPSSFSMENVEMFSSSNLTEVLHIQQDIARLKKDSAYFQATLACYKERHFAVHLTICEFQVVVDVFTVHETLRLNLKHIINGPDVVNAFQGAKSDLHIIIFDEIDSIAKAILENLHAFQIDGMKVLNNIFIIATTNRKELIDEALLREGRIELHVKLEYPDERGCLEILDINTRNLRQAFVVDEDVNLQEIACRTDGCSGSTIASLGRGLVKHVQKDVKVKMNHFLHAIEDIKPRLQESSLEPCSFRMEKEEMILQWFSSSNLTEVLHIQQDIVRLKEDSAHFLATLASYKEDTVKLEKELKLCLNSKLYLVVYEFVV
ncbi:hypothetical protein HYC85_008278 [Camellia sinensis]|uniref:Vesicle-fusing ATPase n=1 Tax=Camellia sinensis TaxID=4442 RepID=A0A7J7HRD3_CAMSI|nr:hypothetical protein HYC85_008278 [Camellia sinensis]